MSRIPNTLGYFVLGAALAGWSSASAASPSYALNQPARVIPAPAGILPAEWNVAQWQNGLLVFQSADVPCTKADVPNLVLADSSGKVVVRHTVWPEGATTVQMIATAVSKQHVIAVSGAASSPAAAEIPFVQEIRPDGTLLREIRTGGFLAFSLAYDDKGDLWMAGSPAMEQGHWPPHQILRRYRNGALVSEHLPYASFQAKYEATTSHKSHPAMHGNEGRAFLVPAPGGVGLWSPGTHEWIEVGSDGAVVGRWQAPYPGAGAASAHEPRVRLVGLAATSSGEVVATIQERNVRNGLYRLDKATSSWQEIAVPEGSPVLTGYVAGADGADVVYRDQAGSGGWAVAALTHK